MGRRHRWELVPLALLASAIVFSACGETTFDLHLEAFGRAIDGDLVVTSAFDVDNQCTPVVSSGSTLTLGGAAPADWSRPGRRVFLQQVTVPFTESGAENVTSDGGAAGTWEVLPIAAVDGAIVTTVRPPMRTYASGGGSAAQACIVREYRALTLQTSLSAAAWNGASGGVLIFFVRDAMTSDTSMAISMSSTGFPGGHGSGSTGPGSTAFDTSAADGGFKGSGVDDRSSARNGRGAYRDAGGGGNANRAGGGGGGSFGSGGAGADGVTTTSGGMGGVALTNGDLAPSRLVFGGGGGGGHAATSAVAGSGGAGGGVILAGARRIIGAVRLAADGHRGQSAVTGAGAGGGGGGGGGAVVFWVSAAHDSEITCFARGGKGGGSLGGSGIGGGGGGGACWTRGVATVTAGSNGGAVAGESGDPGPLPDWWSE